MIYMLWKECMPAKFYRHICKEKKFLYLNRKNVLQAKLLEIITDFINERDDNFKALRKSLFSHKNIFQYVYSNVFLKIYCSTKKRGFDLKSNFHIIFITYKDKKKLKSYLGKNSENYETNLYEQRPINIDDFIEDEENQMKERVEKRKQKRGDVAEKKKL